MAAMTAPTTSPKLPASQNYQSPQVMSFSTLRDKQTPERIYQMRLEIKTPPPLVRMQCGYGGWPVCNATCNPSKDLPVTCNHKKSSPHVHHKNDMIPTLFYASFPRRRRSGGLINVIVYQPFCDVHRIPGTTWHTMDVLWHFTHLSSVLTCFSSNITTRVQIPCLPFASDMDTCTCVFHHEFHHPFV